MTSLLALLLLLSCPPAGRCADGAAAAGPRIRVAISRGAPSLRLRTSSSIYAQDMKSGQKYLLLEKASYEVRPSAGGISVAGQELSSPIKLLAADGQERIRLGGNLYKGDIVLRAAAGGGLDIIEHLPLEEYLYGVLPSEMSADWPLEALKAQAVASRTYAMKYINPARDYDITNGVEMQVYSGTNKINSRVMEAVNSTRGEVLKYRNRLVTAFFHACCGGHTASVRSAWGEDVIKPLYGVPDPFCKPSRHYRWEFYVSSADLLRAVQAQGSTALKIKNMKIHKKDRSGRAVSFQFATDKVPVVVKTTDLRKRFGTFEFRSTLVGRISPVRGGYELAGRGWGHGVGMCQEGAKYMAMNGKPYRKILRHYYPGAAIVDYE
ncbi:MAG: SpoIID/LytB domain-containing protein [Elusimicrobia bacterium]|nr:SpoIID/LytB domain-containing protein [Elusimicrobiota bacterium]